MTRKERLAEYVKRKVEESGLSQREIAKRSESIKDHTVISNIIGKKGRLPSIEMFVGLAEALNVDPFEMLEAYLGRPHIDRENALVRVALEWARLAEKQGDSYWVKKIKQDNEKMRQLIAEGRIATDREPNGGEENDKPRKPRSDEPGSGMVHKEFGGRIAV